MTEEVFKKAHELREEITTLERGLSDIDWHIEKAFYNKAYSELVIGASMIEIYIPKSLIKGILNDARNEIKKELEVLKLEYKNL